MSKITVLNIALIIMLIPFFLTSFGTMDESPVLWWTGLILLGVGGIIPPFVRYVYAEVDENKKEEES